MLSVEETIRDLSSAIIRRAIKDFSKGDLIAAAWLLSNDARVYFEGLNFDSAIVARWIGKKLLEVDVEKKE